MLFITNEQSVSKMFGKFIRTFIGKTYVSQKFTLYVFKPVV